MNTLGPLGLPTWIDDNAPSSRVALSGSATPGISIADLVSLSTDPSTTIANFNLANIPLNLGTFTGSLPLRETIASLFAPTSTGKRITADDVLIMNGTTGANFCLSQALYSPGDHAVVVYPTYMPLITNCKGAGAEVSLWKLDPERDWQASLDDLKTLVRKGQTKVIVLNSPGNPTGRYLRKELLEGVVQVAREVGAVVHCDEIFHPLYHFGDGAGEAPESAISFAANDFDQVAVTGSLSKTWGMSGLRIGWIVSPNKDIIRKSYEMKSHVVQTVSVIDETIATEALSERCRPGILKKNLSLARTNIPLLKEYSQKWEARKQVLFVMPEAGAVAFPKFMGRDGQPVDEVQLCKDLLAAEGTLLSPGTLSFGDEWKGYCRIHFNVPPETFRQGLEAIERYLSKV